MLLSVRMPRQRMDDSFAGDFLFKESLGGRAWKGNPAEQTGRTVVNGKIR